MHLGLALPQYDYSVAGERPLRFDTIVDYAERAEGSGFDSVWMSDHLFLDLAKYGGPPDREACFEPVVTLAALARRVPRLRLGTLVFCEALRPASVLAKALATLDRVCGGRLDVGLGAGWYEPEYEAIAMEMPAPGARLRRLAEAVEVVKGLLPGTPFTFDGEHHRAYDARNLPPACQQPRPRVFVGGKGDRLLRLVAERADGWNTCWTWTTDAYRERMEVLDRACEGAGRDPSSVWRSLGLYSLCGENERDLARRFELMADGAPPGVMSGLGLAEFRVGRLVGTVDQVREQVAGWEALGVDTLIAGLGAVPFHISSREDVELLGERGRERVRLLAVRHVRVISAAAQDAAAFPFGCAAPHAVLDAIDQRVFETLGAHGARGTHALRGLDAGAVGREEVGRIDTATARAEHPRVLIGCPLHSHLHLNETYG